MQTKQQRNARRQLALPDDDGDRSFENMCLAIYAKKYESKDVVFYNRGQPQDGIDIYLRHRRRDGSIEHVVIQCKDAKSLSSAKDDLERAFHWKPSSTSDPDLKIVLATTRTSFDRRPFDKHMAELLELNVRKDLRNKVLFEPNTWEDIQQIVREHEELADYFLDQAPDEQESICIEAQYQAGMLEAALHGARFQEARELLNKLELLVRRQGQPLPAVLASTYMETALAAGDFLRAKDVLEDVIGKRRYGARLWVGYLRARRAGAPRFYPEHFEDMERFVDANHHYLLQATGSLDDQLTLALWGVNYAASAQAGARALLRARDLVLQHAHRHWPHGIPHLQPGARWSAADGSLTIRSQDCERALEEWAIKGAMQDAVVMMSACEFIAILYRAKYGAHAPSPVALRLDAWPKCSFPTADIEPEYFFAVLDEHVLQLSTATREPLRAIFRQAGIGGFYEEAAQMTMSWDQIDEMIITRHMPIDQPVTFSGDALLADCEKEIVTVERRLDAPRTTGFAIERVLRVERMLAVTQAACEAAGRPHTTLLAQTKRRRAQVHRLLSNWLHGDDQLCGLTLNAYPSYLDYDASIWSNAHLSEDERALATRCREAGSRAAPITVVTYEQRTRLGELADVAFDVYWQRGIL